MPSFKKRHNRWEIRFKKTSRKPKEKSESLPADTSRREVKRIEGEMNNAYYGGSWDPWQQSWQQFKKGEPIGTYSIDQAREDYFRFCKRNNRWNSEITIYNSELHVNRFCEFVGPSKQAGQINNDHVISFLNQDEHAQSTIITYHRHVLSFINWLQDKGYNGHEFDYRPSKNKDNTIIYFTRAELDELIEVFRKSRTRHTLDYIDIWRTMYFQCLRSGEVFGKQGIRAWDIQDGQITVRGKGNKTRQVPVVGPIKDMLLERKYEAKKSGRLFSLVSHNAFYVFTKRLIRKHFPEHRHCLDLHSLRRGGGVYWTQQGVPMAAIKELMGHSSITTTERHYARFQPDGMMSVFS